MKVPNDGGPLGVVAIRVGAAQCACIPTAGNIGLGPQVSCEREDYRSGVRLQTNS